MNWRSSPLGEIWAVFLKEWRSEVRSRHGLFTAGLFSLLAVVGMGFASYGQKPSPTLGAGMLCITLLFSAIIALPRTFLLEDEQGTFDLLRIISNPMNSFVGKLLYNLVQMAITALLLGVLFTQFTGLDILNMPLFILGLILEAITLAGAVSLCGALVMGANNRWVLIGVLAMPLLLPQIAMGIGALRVSLGEGTIEGGWQNAVGLFGFGVALLGAGPLLVAQVWRIDS